MGRRRRLWAVLGVICFSLLSAACQGGDGNPASGKGLSEASAEGNANEGDGKTDAGTKDGIRDSEEPEKEANPPVKRQKGEEKDSSDIAETGEGSSFPGSYTIPVGWVQAKQYSNEEITFYVEEGHEEDGFPDNISVSIGTNRYSAEEHESFRKAIMNQIAAQIKGQQGIALYGDGTYTEQGYMLYVFTIEEEAEEITTKQYYNIDDYRYCLVQLTNFTNSEAADKAAQEIVDSFVWETDGTNEG